MTKNVAGLNVNDVVKVTMEEFFIVAGKSKSTVSYQSVHRRYLSVCAKLGVLPVRHSRFGAALLRWCDEQSPAAGGYPKLKRRADGEYEIVGLQIIEQKSPVNVSDERIKMPITIPQTNGELSTSRIIFPRELDEDIEPQPIPEPVGNGDEHGAVKIDTVNKFLVECIKPIPPGVTGVVVPVVYDAYLDWCAHHNYSSFELQEFMDKTRRIAKRYSPPPNRHVEMCVRLTWPFRCKNAESGNTALTDTSSKAEREGIVTISEPDDMYFAQLGRSLFNLVSVVRDVMHYKPKETNSQ